jgi:DNA repair exonuclease SbcCD nuclease subunit
MKIALCSDVHLEFGQLVLKNTEGADVLILSGDICVASELNTRSIPEILGMTDKSNRYHEFFQNCCKEFKDVVYISGNHEHYHGDIALSYNRLKEKLAYLKNLHVLEKECVALGDVTFIAGTLWTDMNKEDPHTLYTIKGYMNDYRIIEDSSIDVTYKVNVEKDKPVGMTDEEWLDIPYDERYVAEFKTRPGKFTPTKSVEEHKAMLKFIDETVAGMSNEKFVVVGHHSPSKLSTKPQYENDVIVNGAYSSDLSEFILDRPQIKAWTHGHTHHKFDYMIGSTRIICNPRGYINYEPEASDFQLQYFEV